MNANTHLNIFRFYQVGEFTYLENNLSRAFAICLQHDPLFCKNILQQLLPEEKYKQLFHTQHPDLKLEIGIQQHVSRLEGVQSLIAVACSGKEHLEAELEEAEPDAGKEAITDVVFQAGGVGIIFEFKRDETDCAAQLQGQVKLLKEAIGDEKLQVKYRDLNWRKIILAGLETLSFQRQIGNENPFTRDFLDLLEKRYTGWFPIRLLQNIPFPQDENDPNAHYLSSRMKQVLNQAVEEEVEEKSRRFYIPVEWGWVGEIQLWPENNKEKEKGFLALTIYPGDTRTQGWSYIFRENGPPQWPSKIKGYNLTTQSYLKFSQYGSGFAWVSFDAKDYPALVSKEFFRNRTGRLRREKWPELEAYLDKDRHAPADWKKQCDWKRINASNRSLFDLSVGQKVQLLIPYEEARKNDDRAEGSPLVQILAEGIKELKRIGEGG